MVWVLDRCLGAEGLENSRWKALFESYEALQYVS